VIAAAPACAGALVQPCERPAAFPPWDEASPPAEAALPPTGLADALVGTYQQHLRRPELPGGGCPFAPSCSVYARHAIDAYGPFGLVLAIDRMLIREHLGLRGNYPVDCVDGQERYRDPVP
jgi:putative component of membrane protein insertase Oxa1/YidC/SpoIIIJ protein YidD